MRIAVILNGISLTKNVFYKKYLPALKEGFDVEVFETRTINDAIGLASKAVSKRFDLIMAAGGDGTVHQVLNGMLRDAQDHPRIPVLAVLPLGSGNDFARSMKLDYSPTGIRKRIEVFHTQEIDVGQVLFSVSRPDVGVASIQDMRYFVNVADVGMGPPVVRGVLKSDRLFGSAVAYYISILKTFATYKPLRLEATAENWNWSDRMRTFAVANARFFGNGLCIAPDAKLDDGEFEVFACGPVSVLDFIIQSVPLKMEKRVNHNGVSYSRCKSIDLSSPEAIEIEADGEILGWLPAKISFAPFRVRILA